MGLAARTKLGQYEILELIGVGGMGEVSSFGTRVEVAKVLSRDLGPNRRRTGALERLKECAALAAGSKKGVSR